MVIMKLKLVKGKATDEAATAKNGTPPDEDDNHGASLLKKLVETFPGRGEIVAVEASYFDSM